jgi:hypothetical protein
MRNHAGIGGCQPADLVTATVCIPVFRVASEGLEEGH